MTACTCRPGVRCEACRQRGVATRRLMRVAADHTDPVEWADRRTSLNDARTALCLATGVPVEHVHPASGHNLGRPYNPTN